MGVVTTGKKWAVHAPAADTAAVVTLAATPKHRHVVWQIDWSYKGGAGTAGNIAVVVGSTTIYDLDLPNGTAGGVYGTLTFAEGLYLDGPDGVNAAMVITLLDPAEASTLATLNVCHDVISQQ